MSDRELQGKILQYLNERYPEEVRTDKITGNGQDNFNRCMHYLYEHELINGQISQEFREVDNFLTARITAQGIDFLADDGGLGAILGVVTIKIHSDSIQQIINAKIEASNIPTESKSKLKEAIKNAPSTIVAEALKRLTGMAFDHCPAALDFLQKTFLGI